MSLSIEVLREMDVGLWVIFFLHYLWGWWCRFVRSETWIVICY